MIPRTMLVRVITDIDERLDRDRMTPHELATHIISGLYKEMRKETTPKPVLLLAACEVISSFVEREKVGLEFYDNRSGQIVICDPCTTGGDPSVEPLVAATLADALIELADGLPE